MPTQFKLRFDSLARRAVFAHHPSWAQLSAKIAALFALPQPQVAVTYLDAEDEEITLSTEDELQDYYLASFRPGDVIKFSVRDLSRRSQAPEQAPFRNTFGQFPDVDIPGLSEWQSIGHVPSLEEILGHSEARGAYVESVPSESDKASEDSSDVRSEGPEPRFPVADKGKDKADSQSMTSTRSLLAEDVGDKYPVHVYDVSAYHPSADPSAFSMHDSGTALAAQSTPRASAPPLDQVEPTAEKESQGDDDPPLPSFDSGTLAEDQSLHSTHSSASLAQDVASFLNIVSNMVTSHPEIGDSLRTIARNTSDGTYWAAHRDAISQAAAEFQRNTGAMAEEGRRMAEKEAGRRITEAFASVLNIFSHAPPATTTQADATTLPPSPVIAPPPTQPTEPVNRADTPSMPGAFSSAGPDVRFAGAFPFSGRRQWRPPMSMPPDFAPGRGNFPPWARHLRHGPYSNATAHQGPSHFTNAFAPVATPDTALNSKQEATADNETHGRPSPEDLKAKVEEAKRAYKAEKERYRKDRDERRRERNQPAARNEGDP